MYVKDEKVESQEVAICSKIRESLTASRYAYVRQSTLHVRALMQFISAPQYANAESAPYSSFTEFMIFKNRLGTHKMHTAYFQKHA